MTYFDFELTHCPVELSVELLSRKWVLQIICDMFFGKTRFSEFKHDRPEMSNKALSRSLKFMEKHELIEKIADEYYLTDKGKSLNRVIYDLVEFTLDNNAELYKKETVIKAKEGFKKQLLNHQTQNRYNS